ncbi:DNA repair protein RecO [candidate division WOR-1 bacterium RIFCSPLOWO2_02_FULL_46_20]|uniref:DNA repair protein RecO n=2 Tax=Saganbacteria TaxID=1703751 RepID=A0A1F4REL7_UNCSA|nr:MAG: DNA repair protein RecO [candidate division WOR-1 bacterium RIFCSPHIGHO2_02_FULL_45_12]OGC06629.1 MAG: DNA repair protein RecO [candidate division WOR-1 bacterium RIFCSPLOWO2_02_FULL_46_20]OGC08769.1 MAG: DNA repair protein RecO [candidate division WOR-1 bacterium RIFCSPLOWO2_12_FULL_45_9]
MATYKTKAVSLKTIPFAEADKMVTLFTRDHGKIRAIAKGACRVPSSLGGRVEPFTYGDYFVAKGRNLDIISQCQIIESFQRVREQESTLPAGMYMLRLVNSGTSEGQHYPELFDLLVESLLRLKNGELPKTVALDFEKKFVVLEGIYHEKIHPRDSLSEHIGSDIRSW